MDFKEENPSRPTQRFLMASFIPLVIITFLLKLGFPYVDTGYCVVVLFSVWLSYKIPALDKPNSHTLWVSRVVLLIMCLLLLLTSYLFRIHAYPFYQMTGLVYIAFYIGTLVNTSFGDDDLDTFD
ncbi:hypothetical protein [Gallaecimonas pentaromativorans]|uniref:hypothetical protein n=1 Tax=Gallaecimonas pentaromativorans TaxID=584787 RepID=UPI003A8FB932